jgi:hypothetical protein
VTQPKQSEENQNQREKSGMKDEVGAGQAGRGEPAGELNFFFIVDQEPSSPLH